MEWEKEIEKMNKILENHYFKGYKLNRKVLMIDLVSDEKLTREKISTVTEKLKSKLFEREPEELKGDIAEILKGLLDNEQFHEIYILTTPEHILDHYYIPLRENLYKYEQYKIDYTNVSYLFYNSDTGYNVGIGFITSSKVNVTPDEIANILGIYDHKKPVSIDAQYVKYEKRLFIIGDQVKIKYLFKDVLYRLDEEKDEEEVEHEVIAPINWIWFFQISYKTLSVMFDP